MNFQQQIAQSLIWRGLYFVTLFVINIFLSRYFQAANAGWIYYVCNNFSFIVIVAGLTMETAVSYYSSKKNIDDSRLAWFSVAWSVMVSVAAFIGLAVYFYLFKPVFFVSAADYFFIALCYITGIQLTNFFTVLFYANKNFFLPNFLMVILNVVIIIIIPKNNVAGSASAWFTKWYFAFFIVTGLVLAIAFIIKKQSWHKVALPAFADVRLMVGYALVALAANVIFFLVYRVDYWFVEKYCTTAQLGNYIQVSKLGQMLLTVPGIISSVVFPHTASEGITRTAMKENILRIGRIMTVLFLVFFIVAALCGQWFFPLVFGYTFQWMYLPFLLLLPGIWALSNLSILSAYFAGVNQVKTNLRGAMLALAVILAGDILFIPRFGIVAAALVSTAGYLVNFFYSLFMLQKEHAVSPVEYWAINKDDILWLRNIIQK